MRRVLVLHTGGTISMVQESTGVVSTSGNHPLEEQIVDISNETELTVEHIFNLPSPHITLEHMLILKQRIQQANQELFDGVVITHGTDTLEETAYFLDLTIDTEKMAVVVTGAMRSSNEVGADGLYNFIQAIRTASSPSAQAKGVLVVMNDEIHAAQFVTKTHTTSIGTFRTPTFGPIGILSKSQPMFFNTVISHRLLDVSTMKGMVPILKVYAGMDGSLFEMLGNCPVDGVVIEALGAGNVPPQVLPQLESLIQQNIPVVLVSRCANGVAEDIYNYEGGGVQLKQMGVMFVKGLSGPKARIRLLVGLNASLRKDILSEYMSQL